MKIPQKKILNQDRFRSLAGLLFIFVITLLLYWPVAGFGWITGLDQVLLVDNKLVYNFNSTNILDIFFSAVSGRYQPLAFLSYTIDIGISSSSAIRTIHLHNLLLHILSIALFFRVIQLLSEKSFVAFMAALLFAVHPMNIGAVAWISSRSELLCTFFFLLGLLSYLYQIGHAHKILRYFSRLFFLLALLSNPMAVVFPLALILVEYVRGKSFREALKGKAIYYLFSTAFLIIALLTSEPGDTIKSSWGFGASIVYISNSLGLLMVKFFLPLDITGLYPVQAQIGIWPSVGIILVLAFIGLAYLLRRNGKLVSCCLIFFVTGALVAIVLDADQQSLFREGQAYFPYLALYALSALGIYQLTIQISSRKIITVLGLLVVGVWISWLVITSYQRLPDWENSDTAWTRLIEVYPDDYHAYFYRGDHWAMNARFDRAKFDYNQCIRFNDKAYEAHNNIGLIYLEEQALLLALDEFNRAIEINEDFYKAHLNKGLTNLRIGYNDRAIESLDKALSINPDEPLAYYNKGLIYERKNQLDMAIEEFTRAIDLDPFRYIFYKDRGKALIWRQRYAEGELDYSRALEIDPTNAEMWFRRSLARISQDKFQGGLEDALVAKELGYPITEDYIKGITVQILEADTNFRK